MRERYIYIYTCILESLGLFRVMVPWTSTWQGLMHMSVPHSDVQFLIQMCTSTSLPQSSQFSNLGSSFHPAFKLGMLWRRMAPGCWHLQPPFLEVSSVRSPCYPLLIRICGDTIRSSILGVITIQQSSMGNIWEIHEPTSEFGETKGLSQSLFERFEVTKTNPNSAELRGRPNVLALLYWDKKGLREQAMTARFL